jgi:hypothetical protein
MLGSTGASSAAALIFVAGVSWYVVRYVWIYRLEDAWHGTSSPSLGGNSGLHQLLRFGGVFSMTIATMGLLGAYIVQHDDSREMYTLLVFAVGGPFVDISFSIFPSKGTLCYMASLILFATTTRVYDQPAYWYTTLLILMVSFVGVIFAPSTSDRISVLRM